MAPTLHGYNSSPPVRSTLLTLKALGLEFNHISVSPTDQQHLTPEFLKLNPLHSIPTLEDGDFVIYDSHAINAYLVDKYAKDDALYPKDLQKRAIVNQRMYFDCGSVFPPFLNAIVAFLGGAKDVAKPTVAKITQAYTLLETLLENSPYAAGENLSLADFNLIATVTSMNLLVPIASNRYPNILKWIEKMQKLPYYTECNQEGLDKMAENIRVWMQR